MSKERPTIYEHIDVDHIQADPVKSFFVSMLTRDIKLEDAILDLLDNCIDGIVRSKIREGDKPYQGFWAEIEIKNDLFKISDNCGGIPWDLHEYAFRMGRAPEREKMIRGTVGVYGIGMKRAIFKIGRHALITTRNKEHQYEVEIKPVWLEDEYNWSLPVKDIKWPSKEDGTTIVVRELNDGVANQFGDDSQDFVGNLEKMVSTHYGYIIEKGFNVKINDIAIKANTAKIAFNCGENLKNPAICPYIYETTTDNGVYVFLAVGFTRPLPSDNDIANDLESAQYSSKDAGWTILCNDRAVVFCDRTELTGWGEADVPRFHNQFNAISGIVEFRSDDPSKLPTTTTKRGIDASSPLYAQIKNKMREGMKKFTQSTNDWKGHESEVKEEIVSAKHLSLPEIRNETQKIKLNPVNQFYLKGHQYNPRLPKPVKPEKTIRRICFDKEITEIKKVAAYLGNPNDDPSEVGKKCFEAIYKDALE
jgi:hypothetical protein